MVKYFGFGAIKDLHLPEVVKMNDGQIYRVITVGNQGGEGQMKGYANTLDITDRWAIVAYVRALQLSRLGKEEEVPDRFHVRAKSTDKKSGEEEKH